MGANVSARFSEALPSEQVSKSESRLAGEYGMAMARRGALLFASLTATCLANFTNPFEDLVEGGKFKVTWDALPEESLPAYILGRAFNTTEDGVTSFQENITSEWLPLPATPSLSTVEAPGGNSSSMRPAERPDDMPF